MPANYIDQLRIFDPTQFVGGLHVIGCGGIGGSVLPTLVTLGITRIHIWDDDIVVDRNLASTLMFRPCDLGRPKVEVAKEVLLMYGAEEVIIHQERFQSDKHADTLDGVVLSAVDDMDVRKDIWLAIQGRSLGAVSLFFDGRIASRQLTLITIDPLNSEHVEWYEKHQLYGNEDTADAVCGMRAVAFAPITLGPHIAAALSRWQHDVPNPRWLQQDMGDYPDLLLQKP